MAMLSTPVCGVESRNEVVAARLAPWRRNDADTGITPHEHSGKRHAEQRRLEHRAEAASAQVPLDELRRNAHRQHARHQESEQQIGRHLAEHRPAFPHDIDYDFHHTNRLAGFRCPSWT